MKQKNVYDIKKEKNLNFILPKEFSISPHRESKVLIIIHLHYVELLDECIQYISRIPPEADVIFTTSNPKMREALIRFQDNFKFEFEIIEKKNRGRDVSALLIEARKYVMNYSLICFLHDKRAKDKETEADTKEFVRCLWENMLGSSDYIHNIVHTFQLHPSLGVLLPPETLSDNFSFVYSNTWDKNYELMCSLAEKLHLNCDLDCQKKPLSLGTAFWAKTSALKKLFDIDWRYEDFDEEPLADDGTISHVIERSFAYIAQDAGYDTGIVMTESFAGERFDKMQEALSEAFEMLRGALDIPTIGSLKKENMAHEAMTNFAKKFKKIYIYGAGICGQCCHRLLNASFVKVDGYMVTTLDKNAAELRSLPVVEFSEVLLDDETGIIIAVNDRNRKEIMDFIAREAPDFRNLFCFSS